jgi:cold shock CspA family protein
MPAAQEPDVTERLRGKVHRIYQDRGFGFIRCVEGRDQGSSDYFFHASGLDDLTMLELLEGELVEFEPRQVPKGLRAEHITRVRG